ncbi:MAG: hypothetical protein O2992_11245 [Gemmatimonadetes bacterium]|nr:hypothetical protein [Gemmatimonadota bacterium]
MSSSRPLGDRTGVTSGDMMVIIAMLAFGLAVAYPRIRERAFEGRLTQAIANVNGVTTAASTFLEATGVLPAEIGGSVPAGHTMASPGHIVQWELWEVVVSPDIPDVADDRFMNENDLPLDSLTIRPVPTVHAIGGVSVHSPEPALLAGLLQRYGAGLSFIRDTTWTMVLPARSRPRPNSPN